MSIMKGKLRRSAVVVAFSLGAFQALSIVGATSAFAVLPAGVISCTFSGGTLTVGVTGPTNVVFSQDIPGNILVGGSKTSAIIGVGSTCDTAVDATTANTTTINVNGTPGATVHDDFVTIQTYKLNAAAVNVTANWGSINWTVNLGDNAALPVGGDSFTVNNSLNTDNDIKTDWGANGIDLNGDGNLDVALAGVEKATDTVGPGTASLTATTTSSTINAGGTTITGGPFPTAITITGTASLTSYLNITGGSGDDTLTGSAASYSTIAGGLGNDSINCAAGDGAVDYTGSLTAVVVDLGAGTGTGEGFDSIAGPCDDINGSDHGDTLTGNANWNWIAVGNGADTVDGVSGPNDTYDAGSATAAVTVDIGAGTSTGGSGTDTLKHIDDASGSAFNDSLTGSSGDNVLYGEDGNDTLSGGAGDNDGADSFDGGAGIDTVDYGSNTLSTTVNLTGASACTIFDPSFGPAAVCGTAGPGTGADRLLSATIENAILGTGNDTFTGSTFNNIVWPNGGQNVLIGCASSTGGTTTTTTVAIVSIAQAGTTATVTTASPHGLLPGGSFTISGTAGGVPVGGYNGTHTVLAVTGATTFTFTITNGTTGAGGSGTLTYSTTTGGGSGGACVAGSGGIDTVNYNMGYTAGVTVNLSGGGGTGGSSDSISGFQNAVGTAFNDTMTGTDTVGGTNGANLLVGGKGNDTISANAGPDLVRGGAGNDRVRGGSGDDTLKAQGGKDNVRGGQGDDDIFGGKGKDFCVGGTGHDLIKTCERPRHHHQGPNGPGVAMAARLATMKP